MLYFNSKVNKTSTIEKRRLLRKSQTKQEQIIWQFLRGGKTGYKWRRQVGIGEYIADFYCHEKKIALEIDGLHHLKDKNFEYDNIREKCFVILGIKTIRILNSEFDDLEKVYQKIMSYLDQ